MSTLAIILVATFLCISIGIPMGIAMARSNKVQASSCSNFRYHANYT